MSLPPSRRPPEHQILRGWIKTTADALLVLEATRAGLVPRVTRRFHEIEKRSIIASGAILVFAEEESGIKRWTDPFLWSASRMQGHFLMYREREDSEDADVGAPYRCSTMPPLSAGPSQSRETDPELEHYILGSWNKGRGLKHDGLMKKARLFTLSMIIDGSTYHLISYYYPSDVRSGALQTPSSMPHLAGLEVSPAVLDGLSDPHSVPSSSGTKTKRGKSTRSCVPPPPSHPSPSHFDRPTEDVCAEPHRAPPRAHLAPKRPLRQATGDPGPT
ncbi:Gti1/Pac2 family-domain-containing protein [Epithele typhae]|uniref:Gti1/Pac2 family-domain-containing protein n=1 Tax=Epithele typhae TaxID=378194 RepID=UPI002007EF4B|nr:Gti1/Pac2 family-domain-containing protein [Epithele typhae]KAH9920539.1 Gti1/Pac2 family-domain-containing protein [Epithele typhae]